MSNVVLIDNIGELAKLMEVEVSDLWVYGVYEDHFDWAFMTEKCFGELLYDDYGSYHNHDNTTNEPMYILYNWLDTYAWDYYCFEYKGKFYTVVLAE